MSVVAPLGQHINVLISLEYNAPELAVYVVLASSIFIRVRFTQLRCLQPAITQYFASNKSEIWS